MITVIKILQQVAGSGIILWGGIFYEFIYVYCNGLSITVCRL